MASIFTKFLGRSVSEAAGFAAGVATGPVLAPVVEEVRIRTWAEHPSKPVDVREAAAIVAEDVEQEPWGEQEAAYNGFNADRFRAMVGEALSAPGLGPLFELWRRGLIGDGDFTHGLRKAKLEGRWDGPLEGLRDVLLSPAELANARQQEFIGDGRLHDEGDKQGYTAERMDLLYKMAGLPPGVETGLEMLRRGIIGEDEFRGIVAEGHTKTKYTDDLLALRQPILTATEYATLHLKGHVTTAEMNAGGALSGYSAEQMNLLYLSMGNPAAPGAMYTAAARGIDGPAGRPVDEAQFQTAIAQSRIRPEYGPMLWAIRYLYPSLFQLTRLVSSGAIDATTGADWARKARYAPEVVAALLESWQGGGTAKADPHVSKAESQLWTALHKSYVAEESDAGVAQDNLTAIGVPATAQAQVLALWDRERALVRKQLSPAQLKKAWKAADLTTDEAVARLVAQGYNVTDANLYLNS